MDDSLLFCLCSCAFLRGSNEVIPFAAFTFRQVTAGRNAGIRVIGAIIIIIFPVHLKSLHLKKCIIKLPTLTRLLSLSDGCLLGGFHLLHAITANDVHGFCGSYALVTAGANIFAGAAGLLGLGDCSVACPFGECSNYIPQADRLAHLKVLPALFLDEIQQRKSGACNRPSTKRNRRSSGRRAVCPDWLWPFSSGVARPDGRRRRVPACPMRRRPERTSVRRRPR